MEPAAADRPRRGSGSQRALRAANRVRLLRALHERGSATQAELTRQTGLSAATVSNLVRILTSEGVVETATTTSSGRRAVLVSLAPGESDRFAVGIDIGRSHVRVMCCAATRRILGENLRALPIGHRPSDTLDTASSMLTDLLDENGLNREDIIGCAVGIPGPIDARTDEIAHGAILPEWVGLHLEEHLTARLGFEVTVENDANLGALAEVWWGDHGVSDDLVFVKVGSGIGSGLVLGGRLHRGHIGISGELGHVGIADYGSVCRCGSRGCLETVASTSAMLHLMRTGGLMPDPQVTDLIRFATEGDPLAVRIVEDAGLALGRALGGLANLLGPQIIVLGGPVAPLGDLLVTHVRRGLARWSSPAVASSTTVVMSSLDVRAEALGACARVLVDAPEENWAPPARDALPLG